MKPASSHENISQMINFMARQEQQIKTKFLYFIKTYRFCGFSYKKKNRRKLSCRFVINSPFNGLPWWPSLWMNQEDLKILHQLPLLYRQPCWNCSMGASATWLDLCVCKSPEKVRFSLLITGTGGVIFFNPIQLQT